MSIAVSSVMEVFFNTGDPKPNLVRSFLVCRLFDADLGFRKRWL